MAFRSFLEMQADPFWYQIRIDEVLIDEEDTRVEPFHRRTLVDRENPLESLRETEFRCVSNVC